MTLETTLVILKPDAIERGLESRIVSIFAENDFNIVAEKQVQADRTISEKHLGFHAAAFIEMADKFKKMAAKQQIDVSGTFLDDPDDERVGEKIKNLIVDYMVSGPMKPMLVQGEDAITRMNKLCGPTFPKPGDNSIRGLFVTDTLEQCIRTPRAGRNIIHSAALPDEAIHQVAVWFPEFTPNPNA